MPERVSPSELAGRPELAGWRVEGDALVAVFDAGSFTAAGAFVAEIARAADDADHHPDVDLRYPGRVQVVTTTHRFTDAAGVVSSGLTTADVSLAATISSLATARGVRAADAGD